MPYPHRRQARHLRREASRSDDWQPLLRGQGRTVVYMARELSLDDATWRREPVGPDFSYDELDALADEVVRVGARLRGFGTHFQTLVEPTDQARAAWETGQEAARRRWEDAVHRRFYARGKPKEVAKLEQEGPSGGFSMFSSRRRRQEEIARLWASSLAIEFEAWAGHLEGIAEAPISELHDELQTIYETLQPLAKAERMAFESLRAEMAVADVEMWDIINAWSHVAPHVGGSLSWADMVSVAILSETVSNAVSPEWLQELGGSAERADIPLLRAQVLDS